MPDPILDRERIAEALRIIAREAEDFLANVDEALVRPSGAPEFDGGMPELGIGSLKALAELVAAADVGATRSTGPRFFHFVMGGVTPAALGADWLTSTLNQSAYNWVSSPLASRIEQVTLGWLKELFGIPAGWSAVMTSAATTANLVGLDSARRSWRRRGTSTQAASTPFERSPPCPAATGPGSMSTAPSASTRRLRPRRGASSTASRKPTRLPSTGTSG